MRKIYMAELRALLDRTELFIKVFGSKEYYKIENWVAEISDPENIRHSKLSAFVKKDTKDYHDKRMFWGKKDQSTEHTYKRPDEPAVHDPLLRGEMVFHPDPAVQGEPDTVEARRIRAEEVKREYENLRINQIKYNPLTGFVTVGSADMVRGKPRPGANFAKKQPMSLLPRNCRTEFYHRASVAAELTFHIGFLFDGNRCDLKEQEYFFAFDAWTWAQWWILPPQYASYNNRFIPVNERLFLPNFRNPGGFLQHEKLSVLASADVTIEQIDAAEGERLPYPGFNTELPPPTLSPIKGSPRLLDTSMESEHFARWGRAATAFVVEHKPGAADDTIIAHEAALEDIEALSKAMEQDKSILPIVEADRLLERMLLDTTSRVNKGYHLIFQSLGYAGLKDLINDIYRYVDYFLAAFYNPHKSEVNDLVRKIALKMIQLNRILLHNEVLIAPSKHSVVGICLIPSRPLPRGFSFGSFRTPGTNAFKSFQEAVKHQDGLLRLGGNRVPITLLNTFTGSLELLEQRQLRPPYPDCVACRTARGRSGGNVNALCLYHRDLQTRQATPPHRAR